MKPRSFLLIAAALLAALLLQAQIAEQTPAQNPVVPTITYDRVWEPYTPQEITFTAQSTGPTRYLSRNPFKTPDQRQTDPDFTLEFTLSAATRDKLFRLAKEANYFHGDFTYKKHAVSSTGKKTLTYADQARHFETTYDYTENKEIQEITNIFQGISNTIEHGRKLEYLRRFDKLGLEEELKGMESLEESNFLAELQLIAPTLESIANDPAILNIARQRARRLLAKIPSEAGGSQPQKQ
jgi:hypothetical protein